MTKVLNVRVDDDLGAWVEEYAEARGVDKSTILRNAVESFKADCEGGVPELREQRKVEPPKGVGACVKRRDGLGHVWKSPQDDPLRSCVFCGVHGREPMPPLGDGGGHFAEATMARTEVFNQLKAPMQSGTGDPEKVKLSPAQQARAAQIVAEKKVRDAEAVANGTARPGQIAGAPKRAKS